MPLFAQTLSFSPLTPAKPGESSSGGPVGGPGSRESSLPPLTLNPTPVKETTTTEVVTGKDGASEVRCWIVAFITVHGIFISYCIRE